MSETDHGAGVPGKLALAVFASFVPHLAFAGTRRVVATIGTTLDEAGIAVLLVALLVITVLPVVEHVILKRVPAGAAIVVSVSALAAGFGSLAALAVPEAAVVVLAALPGYAAVVNPETSRTVASAAFKVKDGAGLLVGAGIVVSLSLVLADVISLFTCEVIVVTGAVLAIIAGGIVPLLAMVGSRRDTGEPTRAIPVLAGGRHASELCVKQGMRWGTGWIAWGAYPALLLVVARSLAGLASLGSGLPLVTVAWITIASLAAGAAIAAAVHHVSWGKPAITHAYSIATTLALMACAVLIESGVNIIITRVVALLVMPGAVLSTFTARVPLARATGLSVLRVLAVVVQGILLVAASAFFDARVPGLFPWLFLVATGAWVAVAAVQLWTGGTGALGAPSCDTREVDARA